MKKTLATLVTVASALTMHAAFAQTAAPAGASAPAMSAASQAAGKARHEQRVEDRINYLHTQLKITSAQESQWKTFADVMRNNSETMGKLFEQRRANANVSALDDMKQYAEITQAHADGTKKLVDAFDPLYNSFSPEQKKLADETFRRQPPEGRPQHRRSGKAAAPASDATVKP
ncbi:Spy/CpxP family protein refolding chaperone [Paraburkholderia sp. Tr-20389]|uniref:Spy/CpxP family protein refolding chaperone n=1 Tax=Paraburkholderia sp. Tr-20389 TaxID=2703903 RepID=UPI00197F7E5A|nr:Spy/CpxP family protein refolding chaperone [Paraburkholderia sp. Tr-20389]MBN3753549.1 Spy/CpxP family protein refolding chaperone [Paraburkholderia sp. Tr-20389]